MREYSKGYVCKDRGMWKAVVSWQDKDGRKRRLTKSTGIRCSTKKGDNRHKAAAQAFLEKWRQGLVDAEAPAGPSPGGAAATLAEYCASFLATHHVKESTMSGYRAGYRRVLGTPMGDKPVGEVGPEDVRLWEAGMREDGLPETTIAHYHAFLAQVLKRAHLGARVVDARHPVRGREPARRHPVGQLLPLAPAASPGNCPLLTQLA